MNRPFRSSSVRTFGGGTSVLSRTTTVGSLVSASADAEVKHFIRRRRSSAVWYPLPITSVVGHLFLSIEYKQGQVSSLLVYLSHTITLLYVVEYY